MLHQEVTFTVSLKCCLSSVSRSPQRRNGVTQMAPLCLPKPPTSGVRTREHQGEEDRLRLGEWHHHQLPRSPAQSCPHVQVQVQPPMAGMGPSQSCPARPLPDRSAQARSRRRSQSGQNREAPGFESKLFFSKKTSGLKREKGFSSPNLHLLNLDYI